MCVFEACDVRVTVPEILKEKLTLKSPDEVEIAIWNPRHRLDDCAWQTQDHGTPEFDERGDTRTHDDRDEEEVVPSHLFSALFCDMWTT